ncbi:hypothetical protein T11_16313 [Trichinella zimbabwensis]|uniref:Uncharacterized protein n=1 Tax=Trichinella zimbabwensis TaxID=268475 RepID=A0A0V1HWU2_9BILA|nr:hypothetical protein T11_16313 [Trichinella zimbabwensis]
MTILSYFCNSSDFLFAYFPVHQLLCLYFLKSEVKKALSL